MGKHFQQQPAPQQTPVVAPVPAIVAKQEDKPAAAFDSTRTIHLLVRDSVIVGEAALAGRRPSQMYVAIQRLDEVVTEMKALIKLEPIAGSTIAGDVAVVRKVILALASALTSDKNMAAYGVGVLANVDSLQNQVGPVSGTSTVAAPLTQIDQAELASQEVLATRREVAHAIAARPGDAATAALLCEPIHRHLNLATRASDSLDRYARDPLERDVELLSNDMATLAQRLARTPRFEWKIEFASAFDAENKLRASLGLPAIMRPYSGHTDPAEAARFAGDAAADTKGVHRIEGDGSPADYAAQVVSHVRDSYDSMILGMQNFHNEYVDDNAPNTSISDLILKAALIALLTESTAGLGIWLGNALMRPSLIPVNEAVSASGKAALATTTLVNANVTALAKTSIGTILKFGGDKLTGPPPAMTGAKLLTRFVNATTIELHNRKVAVADDLAKLTGSLAQLDVAVLQKLSEETSSIANAASTTLTDHAQVEYQNLKAQEFLGLSKGSTDPTIRNRTEQLGYPMDIPGVLELDLSVSGDHDIRLTRLRLGASERAAREFLQKNPNTLGSSGLNRQYRVHFDKKLPDLFPSTPPVTFGVGAHTGLQLDTLDEQEWALLRLFATDRNVETMSAAALRIEDRLEGDPTGWNAALAFRRAASRNAAIQKLQLLVQFGDLVSTREIES